MAEVTTSKSTTSTQCSPPAKKARMEEQEDTADAFKPAGSLTFRIDNFREFSKPVPENTSSDKKRECDTKVSLRGLKFELDVYPVRCVPKKGSTEECMCMSVGLWCDTYNGCNVEVDESCSFLASVTLRIKTLLKSNSDEIYQYTHRFPSFDMVEDCLYIWRDEPWSFDYLMDPKRGLYNEKDDTLELIVELSVDPPIGVMELPKTDIIQVNEQTVEINKNQLALHSRYFHNMFYNEQFDEGKSGEYKVEIEEPATVDHFKRMLDSMYPENRELDDWYIEGVLHLANRFLVTVVEGKCLEFLMEKSAKPALFKYRIAEKYGYTVLKKYVLDNLKTTDFEKELYGTNIAEYVQLRPDAAKAYMARYDELFPPPRYLRN